MLAGSEVPFAVLEHHFMVTPSRQLVDFSDHSCDEFWRSVNAPLTMLDLNRLLQLDIYLPGREVKAYVGLGMVLIKGELLRMKTEHLDKEELKRSLQQAVAFKVCKIPSLVVTTSLGTVRVGCAVGTYSLYYGCTWKGRVGLFQNQVLLEKWQQGYKTCAQYVVLLQRRRRKLLRERTVLPVAMALHARLGKGAGIAGLGEDILEKICSLCLY